MKALVDRLSAELTERYDPYLETFLVDLWSDEGNIEFHCGFTLRTDHMLRKFTIKVPALYGDTDDERAMIIAVIFEEIQDRVDQAISATRTNAN